MKHSTFQKYDLNHKFDDFIAQYSKKLKEARVVTAIGEYRYPQKLKDFIESKAVYAEMKWPSVYTTFPPENNYFTEEFLTWEKFNQLKPFSFSLYKEMSKDINQPYFTE